MGTREHPAWPEMEIGLYIRPHPGPLPRGEGEPIAIAAVTALLVIAPKARRKLSVFVSPKPGRRFTLSSGERAGVRASVHLIKRMRFCSSSHFWLEAESRDLDSERNGLPAESIGCKLVA